MIPSVLLVSFASLLTQSAALLHNPTKGSLQCQCTCSPVGIPDKTIYTSGNLNIIDNHVHSETNAVDKTVVVKETEAINTNQAKEEKKIVKQFKDIATPTMKSSSDIKIEEKIEKNAAIQHTDLIKPQIRWTHTARSNLALTDENQPTKETIESVKKVDAHVANGVIKTKDTHVNENTKPMNQAKLGDTVSFESEQQVKLPAINVISEQQLPVKLPSIDVVTERQVNHHAMNMVSEQQINKDTVGIIADPQIKLVGGKPDISHSEIPKQILSVLSSHSVGNQDAAGSFNQGSSMIYSSNPKKGDQVAADIGFVMDGGALNPILSGVMSGMGGTGSGFIVESINNTPNRGKFVDNVEAKPLVSSGMIASGTVSSQSMTNNGAIPSTSQSINGESLPSAISMSPTSSLSNGGSNQVISDNQETGSNTQISSKTTDLNQVGNLNNNNQGKVGIASKSDSNNQMTMPTSGVMETTSVNNQNINNNNQNQMTSNNNNNHNNHQNRMTSNNNNNNQNRMTSSNNNNQNRMTRNSNNNSNNNQMVKNNNNNQNRMTNNNNNKQNQNQMTNNNNGNNQNRRTSTNNNQNQRTSHNNNNNNKNQMGSNNSQQKFPQNNSRNNNANKNVNNNSWRKQQNGGNNQHKQQNQQRQTGQNKFRNNNNWNPHLFNEFNLKPFQVQRDQKPTNNNNQWGNTAGETWAPTTVIPYGMDPNMFFSLTI